MKKELWTCDIEGCSESVPESNRGKEMDVIFRTEQTEGRAVSPYISRKTLDICPECVIRIISTGRYIRAYGAQGFNTYELRENGK